MVPAGSTALDVFRYRFGIRALAMPRLSVLVSDGAQLRCSMRRASGERGIERDAPPVDPGEGQSQRLVVRAPLRLLALGSLPVRWLAPSASAGAELGHDSPSARKASTAACRSSTSRTSTTTSRVRRGTSTTPGFAATGLPPVTNPMLRVGPLRGRTPR